VPGRGIGGDLAANHSSGQLGIVALKSGQDRGRGVWSIKHGGTIFIGLFFDRRSAMLSGLGDVLTERDPDRLTIGSPVRLLAARLPLSDKDAAYWRERKAASLRALGITPA
jgi:hypothetical protein